MTELQQLALDAILNLGPMTADELATACLRDGRFRLTIESLFKRGMLEGDDSRLLLTVAGRAQARIIITDL